VIGRDAGEPLKRFVTGMAGDRFTPAGGEGTVCGVVIETDDATGLCRRIAPLRVGGRLPDALPEL